MTRINIATTIKKYSFVSKKNNNSNDNSRKAATPAGRPAKGGVGAVKGAVGKIQGQLASIGSLLQGGSGINDKHSIFVTSSVGGKLGGPGQAAYCMSKHAINGYLEGIRVELGDNGIHIGIICPGQLNQLNHHLVVLVLIYHVNLVEKINQKKENVVKK